MLFMGGEIYSNLFITVAVNTVQATINHVLQKKVKKLANKLK